MQVVADAAGLFALRTSCSVAGLAQFTPELRSSQILDRNVCANCAAVTCVVGHNINPLLLRLDGCLRERCRSVAADDQWYAPLFP